MLADIINYTEKVDGKIILAFKSAGQDMPDAELLFSYILNSQRAWINRIQNEQVEFGFWQLQSKNDFEQISIDNMVKLKTVLAHVPLDKVIHYKNSKGAEFENTVQDILFHLLNHSTYHRAQIATIFKKSGFEPPVTDYIILKRENQL